MVRCGKVWYGMTWFGMVYMYSALCLNLFRVVVLCVQCIIVRCGVSDTFSVFGVWCAWCVVHVWQALTSK